MAETRIIEAFNGGVSDSSRKQSVTEFSISKHFDIFSDPRRLIPYRDFSADTNDGSTSTGMKQYMIKDYVYSSTSTILYGMGQNATGLAELFYKADATTGNWTVPASSTGNGAVQNGCLLEFKDYLWGFQGTNQIFKYGTLSGGTPTITNTATGGTVATAITSVANGFIAADGNAYLFYNNAVVRISPTLTITDVAKIVPVNYKITSACNYGSYMAIAAAPISTFNGNSKLFIWNLSSDLFQDTVDLGEGEVRIVENVEGMLVCVIDRYLNNAVGAGRGSMIIQGYTGGQPQVLKEVFTQALTGKTIPVQKSIKNNRLFFAAKIMTNTTGTTYNEGIWSFGRKNASYPWALNLDVISENISTSGIQGFGMAGNYFFISHSGDGSIDKTSSTATYTFSSIYESQVHSFGNANRDKGLRSVTVSAAPNPTGGTVTVKYRVNNDTSWTTIGSFVVGGLSGVMQRIFVNIESTGADFSAFKEMEVRIESTGGAEITGYRLTAELLNEIPN